MSKEFTIDYADSFGVHEPPSETDLLPDEVFESETDSRAFMRQYEYDVAVIGGGPAGQSAAIRAAKIGAKVIMFEREALGGLWLNAGCIPAKSYLIPENGVYDFGKAVSRKNNISSKLTSDSARNLRSCRVRIEAGEAILKSAHEIVCRGRVYNVSKIILCCGSKALKPSSFNTEHPDIYTSGDLFKLAELPPRLLILGGNHEGCEIAFAFASYGSNVMLIEPSSSLLPGWDADISEAVAKALINAGVKVHPGITIHDIGDKGGHPYVITERGGVLCDKVLISSDRKPDIGSIGSLGSAIELDDGVITVNEYMETSFPGIYAAGDITGLDFQTQAACKMGEVAAMNAMGRKTTFDIRAIPMTVYTTPEAASVGITEDEAQIDLGDELVVGVSNFSSNIRAILNDKTEGFVKVLAGKKYGEILGVHIFGATATEMISEAAAMMRMEVTIHEIIGDIFHAHPTYSEAFAEACQDAVNKTGI